MFDSAVAFVAIIIAAVSLFISVNACVAVDVVNIVLVLVLMLCFFVLLFSSLLLMMLLLCVGVDVVVCYHCVFTVVADVVVVAAYYC